MTTQGGVVLDASAAVTWLLGDGSRDDEATIDEVLTNGFVLVPELWHAEVANALRSAIRSERIDVQFVDSVCELLDRFDVRTDVVGTQVSRLFAEAHDNGLTAYDACYLLLARDRGLPLATLDRELAVAAQRYDVELVL